MPPLFFALLYPCRNIGSYVPIYIVSTHLRWSSTRLRIFQSSFKVINVLEIERVIMRQTKATVLIISLVAMVALVACGGGGDSSIGGTISGLGSGLSLTLQNNNADYLTIGSNQSFTFAKSVASNSAYDVTVLTQPIGQTCSVANGNGTVDSIGDAVSNVAVSCVYSSSVGGVVTGLNAGTSVTLSTNGAFLPIATNGLFAFPGTLPSGSTYDVTVSTQPSGQSCAVSNPTGVVVENVMSTVTVNCT